MAWDPTFDWADKSSFNGEPRKYSIINEIITQINIKCGEAGISSLPSALLSGVLGIIEDMDDKVQELIPYYGKTLASIEAEIGSANPPHSQGNLFTPTWINWTYQAIELLVLSWYSEYWNGSAIGSASGAVLDANWQSRWNYGAAWAAYPGESSISTVNQTLTITKSVGFYFSFKFTLDHKTPQGTANIFSVEVEVTCNPSTAALSYCRIDLGACRMDIYYDHVEMYNTGSGDFVGDYTDGVWKATKDGFGLITLYFDGVKVWDSVFGGQHFGLFGIGGDFSKPYDPMTTVLGPYIIKNISGNEIVM